MMHKKQKEQEPEQIRVTGEFERLKIELTFIKKMLDFMSDKFIDFEDILWSENNFYANCSDLFWWGCADAEKITDKTFSVLKQSLKDIETDTEKDTGIGIWLYCCRQRKMRPQGAAYEYIKKEHWDLFDKCGPERKSEFGNPKEHK